VHELTNAGSLIESSARGRGRERRRRRRRRRKVYSKLTQ